MTELKEKIKNTSEMGRWVNEQKKRGNDKRSLRKWRG